MSPRSAQTRRVLLLLLFLVALVGLARPAMADGIALRNTMCAATTASHVAPARLGELAFECGRAPEGYRQDWLWLRTEQLARLGDMPAGWQLLVDTARFAAVEIVVTHRDGSVQHIRRGVGDLGRDWSLGGDLVFTIERPGAEIEAIALGFHRLAILGEVRNVKAFAPEAYQTRREVWLFVIGLALGVLAFSVAYNLFLYAGLRYGFQRNYLLWAVSALMLTLFLSNVAYFAVPSLAGPTGMRLNYLFAAFTIGSGTLFFFSFIEAGKLPRLLVRAGRAAALGVIALGPLCATDMLISPVPVDRLNLLFYLANPLLLAAGIVVAIARGSRNGWYFLAGWSVPLAIYALRLGRSLAGLPQSNLLDMATLGGLALEAIIISLAIADRFRWLRRERDLAREEGQVAEIERRTLERVAWTDMLTGLSNRAAFDRALRAAGRTPSTLVLVDLDHFKPINDSFGHAVGDAVLRQIGAAFSGCAPAGALAARLGGDEFAFLLPPGEEARVDALLAGLEALQGMAWSAEDAGGRLHFSVGAATAPAGGWLADLLYKNADLALYEAKMLGRGQARRYAPPRREAGEPAPAEPEAPPLAA